MKLIHDFPYAPRGPVDWPADHASRTRWEEDGDETTLFVIYTDRRFSRPIAPQSLDELRAEYAARLGEDHA